MNASLIKVSIQTIWSMVFHLWLLCFLERGDLLGCWCFYYLLFSLWSPKYGWWVLEFIFEVKVLQEDLLASLMIYRVFALCCLYLFKFSDEGFILNFLRVAWCSLMFLHSFVNHGLCFGDIMVLRIVLFAILMRVLVKCIMGSSWFVFDSGISVERHSFL